LRLRVHARWPHRQDCTAAVVLVPPGFEWGARLMDAGQADMLTDHGVAVVSWDPRGRGASDGEEDANGHESQDDLASLLRWVSVQDGVDPQMIVLSSRSFGGALAAGALGRHPDLAVAGWVDVESPGFLSDDLAYAPQSNQDRFALLVPDDPASADAWWAEREPAQLIAELTQPYHRFQGLPDHALGYRTMHATNMLHSAQQASMLRYNNATILPEDVSPSFVREGAISGGISADDPQVGDGVLWFLGVGQ